MTLPAWGLVFALVGVAIWLYLAASARVDRRERMSEDWIRRWHQEHDR